MTRLLDTPSDEALLLGVIGITLLVAGITQQLDVSAAVGAFLVGIAISGSVGQRVAGLVNPLRDLFAALFFILFGFQIDPGQIPDVLPIALLLVVVTGAHEGRHRMVGGETRRRRATRSDARRHRTDRTRRVLHRHRRAWQSGAASTRMWSRSPPPMC